MLVCWALALCLSPRAFASPEPSALVSKESQGALDAAVAAQATQSSASAQPLFANAASEASTVGADPKTQNPGDAQGASKGASAETTVPQSTTAPPQGTSPALKQKGAVAAKPPLVKKAPPAIVKKPPVIVKKYPPPAKKVPRPPAPTYSAMRFQKMIAALTKFGVFSNYIATVKATGFDQYIAGLGGYSLTFLVPPDSVMTQLKSTQPFIRLQVLKYMTLYGSYTKAQLDGLKPGSRLVSTNKQRPVFKLALNKLNGRATDKAGASILQEGILKYPDVNLGNWVVHKVSLIMSPPMLDPK